MFGTVAVPVWLLVLILGFAAISFATHFLFPSVRWFFRRRAEKALTRLNARLDRKIDLFKLAQRSDMVARLAYDAKVVDAAMVHAAETGVLRDADCVVALAVVLVADLGEVDVSLLS